LAWQVPPLGDKTIQLLRLGSPDGGGARRICLSFGTWRVDAIGLQSRYPAEFSQTLNATPHRPAGQQMLGLRVRRRIGSTPQDSWGSVLTRWNARVGRQSGSATVSATAELKAISGGVSIMSWFFIALCAPFLLACANHNDKFLLSRYLKQKSIGSIVILSSLFSGVVIPISWFIQPDVYDVSFVQGTALVATGVSSVFAGVCYLYALDIDEASYVTPFYQTVPIFAYFLGYFILDETITLAQGLGSFVIIVGALALSFESGRRGLRFKRNVVALMLGASFLSAVNGVIFKLIAVDKGFWFRFPGDSSAK
jgi:uncharacterized membrane protein